MAKILEKLRSEEAESRSRQSNDKALADSKSTSVVRKHMSCALIRQKTDQAFYQDLFKRWLNFHRPCLFATYEHENESAINIGTKIKNKPRPPSRKR